MSYIRKIRDEHSYMQRLERFLSDKCLLFNPYSISDKRLWEGLMKMRWRDPFSLTQMVILHFCNIQDKVSNFDNRERVVFTVGDSSEKIAVSMAEFTFKQTAADSLHQVRSLINGKPITQAKQIHALVGKSVFISRNIITVNRFSGYGKAMSMHRLKGKLAEDAAIIRTAIINSKLEMLDRLLSYPNSEIYLDGEPPVPVDIATPINQIKARIQTYPTVVPPCD